MALIVSAVLYPFIDGWYLDPTNTMLLCGMIISVMVYWCAVKNGIEFPYPFEVDETSSWIAKSTCVGLFILSLGIPSALAMPQDSIYTQGHTIVQKKIKNDTIVMTDYIWRIVNSQGDTCFNVYINRKTGHCMYYRTSKRTGNKYPVYLPETYSRQIAKELKIPYVDKRKK
jgi:hypothetical protein